MDNALSRNDIHKWALAGAEQRLLAIAEEARAIFAAFPELRAPGRGFDSQVAAGTPGSRSQGSAPRRPTISAEGRQRIAEAQRARWARLKGTNTEAGKSDAARVAKPEKRTARKGMSSAARKAQGERMRAYWAAKRKNGK